jgi:hypothetical protein
MRPTADVKGATPEPAPHSETHKLPVFVEAERSRNWCDKSFAERAFRYH